MTLFRRVSTYLKGFIVELGLCHEDIDLYLFSFVVGSYKLSLANKWRVLRFLLTERQHRHASDLLDALKMQVKCLADLW